MSAKNPRPSGWELSGRGVKQKGALRMTKTYFVLKSNTGRYATINSSINKPIIFMTKKEAEEYLELCRKDVYEIKTIDVNFGDK